MNIKTAFVNFFIITILAIHPALANDDPCTATEIEVGSTCTSTTFSNATATNTISVPDPACAGYAGGDIWFQFTMPNNGYHTVLELSAGSMTDGGMAVYRGVDCSSLTFVSCDDNSGSGNMPLIIVDDGCGFEFAGSTFWVRVWENGNNNNGTFDICAYTQEPSVVSGGLSCGSTLIAGDACCEAILLGEELDGFCGNNTGYTDQPDEIPEFCAFVDNNTWMAFVASETSVDISITSSSCISSTQNGLQAAILETSDCNTFTLVSNCWNPEAEGTGHLINSNPLVIGETYYIMIDGWAGDSCSYELALISGVQTVEVTVDDAEICQGESTQLHANVIGSGPYTYSWSPTASLDDPTSANPIATPGTSTDYTVTITGITDNIHTASVAVYTNAPAQPTIIGPGSVCENATGIIFSSPVSNTSEYTWSVTGSATITGGNGKDSIIVDWGTSGGSVCLVAGNNCGQALSECNVISINSQPDITVTDPPVACGPIAFDLNTIQVMNNGGGGVLSLATFFPSLPDAVNGTNEIFPPIVNSGGTYYVKVSTGPDCFDIDPVEVVIEEPELLVVQPGAKCSPDVIDLSSLTINEITGFTGGTKTYFTDSLDAVNNTSELTNQEVSSTGTYWVRYETPNGCIDVAAINVVIDVTPNVTLEQPAPLCPGGCINLDTITINNPNGAVFTKHFYDNQIFAMQGLTVLAINPLVCAAQCYYLRLETANNCFQIVEICLTEGVVPDAAISGGGTFCVGDSTDIVFTLNGGGPFDVVINDGTNDIALVNIQDSHSERVEVTGNTSYTLVSVSDANGCSGNLPGTDVNIATTTAPTGTISGDASNCGAGFVNINFAFTGTGPFDAEYTDGTTVFPINNAPANHTVALNVSSTTTFALVSVQDDIGCSGSVAGSATIDVTAPLMIFNVSENCDASFASYTVSFEISGGDPGSYSVTGNTGTLTGSTFVSDPITSGTIYNFSISDSSPCAAESITGSQNCACGNDAGQMNLTLVEVCEDQQAITNLIAGTNTINPGDLFEYVLHDNAGAILGNDFAFSNTPSFAFQSGMTLGATYYISPITGPDDGNGHVDVNHLCFSISQGTPVIFYELPEVVISGSASICEGSSTDLVFNFPNGTGPFEVVVSDGTQDITIPNLQDGDTYAVSPTMTTTYVFVSVTDGTHAVCSGTGSGNAVITVNQAPQISAPTFICNNTNTAYQVSFEITGGDPGSYAVTGDAGTIDNTTNIFSSDFINSGMSYSFQVSDGNNCGAIPMNGSFTCDCSSNAGTMDGMLLEVCESEMAMATHITTDLELDGNDVLGFILYDPTMTLPGAVILTGTDPDFAFDPVNLSVGTTYVIAAVVGNDDGTGTPVLDSSIDPCVSISDGQPVVFTENPVASISGTNTICQGDPSDIVFNISGQGPFDLIYNDGVSDVLLAVISDGHVMSVNPDQTTIYNLVSVEMSNVPSCGGTIDPGNNSVSIDVIEIPVVSNVTSDCNQQGTSYAISFEINGGNAAGYTVLGNSGTLNGNVFTSDLLLGGSTYTFEISDGSMCPPIVLTATEYCNCTPDIQPSISIDQAISCNSVEDGILVVTNQNGEAPFSFTWSNARDGELNENLGAGWHYVTMTDANNCTSVDSIFLDEPSPILVDPDLTMPACFGDQDGIIDLANTTGGAGDYRYSLNVASSYTASSFYNLSAGTYKLIVEDANGCLQEEEVVIEEPVELNVDLGENIILQLGDSVEIRPMANMSVDSFVWRPAGFLECLDCWNQSVKPIQSMEYTLMVMTGEGCTDTESIQIIVNKERPIFIPTAFSPNGDGENDVFRVYPGQSVELIREFRVFDRWGASVYETKDVFPGTTNFGWNGMLKGKVLGSGVYVYFLDVLYKDGQSERIRGDVTLMK